MSAAGIAPGPFPDFPSCQLAAAFSSSYRCTAAPLFVPKRGSSISAKLWASSIVLTLNIDLCRMSGRESSELQFQSFLVSADSLIGKVLGCFVLIV